MSGSRAVFVISVAAELAGMHPQTLRSYERRGLLEPARTPGGTRRYSEADVERLLEIQRLSETGLNVEGIKMVLGLRDEVAQLEDENTELRRDLRRLRAESSTARANELLLADDVVDLLDLK